LRAENAPLHARGIYKAAVCGAKGLIPDLRRKKERGGRRTSRRKALEPPAARLF
jgi:hypothetical protein